MTITSPPADTTSGYRAADGSMWFACKKDGQPGIAFCQHPGNLLSPATYRLVAVFERDADRDFVLRLHREYVTGSAGIQPTDQPGF